MSPASYQTAPPRVAYVLGGLGPLTIVEVNSRHTAAIGKAPFVSLRNIKGGFRPPMKANLAFQPSFVTALGPSLPPYRRSRAGNGTRTRDPNLGKVVLYQLSYSRRFAESTPAGVAATTTYHIMEARGIEPLTS